MSKGEIAVCNCGAPLVSTFMFSGAEYFCVECGSKYGMFDTDRAGETPELNKRLARNEKKWAKLKKGLMTGGVMFTWCDTCREKSEAHIRHATPEEHTAHNNALKQLEKITS